MPASDSDEETRGDAALDGPLREREEHVLQAVARRHGITSVVRHPCWRRQASTCPHRMHDPSPAAAASPASCGTLLASASNARTGESTVHM